MLVDNNNTNVLHGFPYSIVFTVMDEICCLFMQLPGAYAALSYQRCVYARAYAFSIKDDDSDFT